IQIIGAQPIDRACLKRSYCTYEHYSRRADARLKLTMHLERLDEPVPCRADFSNGRVTPLAFRRGGREHVVRAVHSRWLARAGRHPQFYFSAETESGDVYELRLDSADMVWHVQSVMLEG